jgi:hypothetical protein
MLFVPAAHRPEDLPYAITHRAADCFMCLPRLSICIKIESTHPDQAIPMTDDTDPDKLKGPGGLTLRQIHEQVQKSVERDRQEQASRNTVATQRTRWQRWVRYVWGRSGRR